MAAKKRQLAALSTLKSTTKSVDAHLSQREQARLRKKLLLRAKLRQSGLAGMRLGKHVVQESAPDVQLGEDLSESLRGLKASECLNRLIFRFLTCFRLKVEGNLFRDRFLSLQHRALLEPRVPVLCVITTLFSNSQNCMLTTGQSLQTAEADKNGGEIRLEALRVR